MSLSTGAHTFKDGGLTQMSLLFQNTVTFSGYTPKHIVSSPLLLCNQIHAHTDLCTATDYCHQTLLAVQVYGSNSEEHLRISVDFSLSLRLVAYFRLREEY